MRRLLHVIADYAPMSQEFGEILQRLWTRSWDLDMTVLPTSVRSMDTIGTGFLTYQLAMGPNPPRTVVMWTDGFGNTKTSIRRSVSQAMWSAGQKVHIRIGGRRAAARRICLTPRGPVRRSN